jgi:hypothetical protein
MLQKIAVILFLCSCSAKWHLHQAYKKDPTLLESKTIVRMDTVITPPVLIRDTLITATHDTIEKETTEYKYKLVRVHDTILMDVECKTDTIYREVSIDCPPNIEVVKGVSSWYKWGLFILLGLILFAFLRGLFTFGK